MESIPSTDSGRLPQHVFLSSLESRRFEGVFEAKPVRALQFESGKPAVVVELNPAASPEGLDVTEPVDTVLLTSRFEGDNILEWNLPLFVHIALLDDEGASTIGGGQPLSAAHATSIAWGEIYATREKAERHELQ